MSKSRRVERLSSLLKKEITLIIMNDLGGDINNYDFVSITKIEISGDLQFCKIYVKSGDNESINDVVENLNLAKNKIKYILSQRIDMRRIPEIMFKEDRVIDKGLNVLRILDEIKVKNNLKEIISSEDDNE